mmetsp:Transcript_14031/g.21313  ORF Transcript_14031/g.21313 Transcript_14031/m.21313 type:complete len:119 (-) Transcript_14031:987-1343(-)
MFHNSAYLPLRCMSSSCVPCSTTLPSPNTTILSALRIVPSRCAIMRQVRSVPRLSKASWTLFSVMVSSALVASSNTTKGGSLRRHRAMAVRCFSPPDSFSPRSPTWVFHVSGRDWIKS